jgi:sugar lactone lactonase YvrE
MRRRTVLALSTIIPAAVGGSALAANAFAATDDAESVDATSISSFPTTISVPNGFAPEGIAISGAYAYLGSRATGSVYKASLRTGTGSVIYTGPGTPSNGLKIDSRGRAFISGNTGGDIRVISISTGALLKSYQVATAGTIFINDVVLTKNAAWFTDSFNAKLYKLAIASDGTLADSIVTLDLTGITITGGGAINLNGIEQTPDAKSLLVVQSNTGLLFKVDKSTGVATQVDLGGASVINGDGLLLEGCTLYVVQNRSNQVSVFTLNNAGTTGTLDTTITNDGFAIPTTAASFGNRLYIVNGKLTTPIAADVTYNVIAVTKP